MNRDLYLLDFHQKFYYFGVPNQKLESILKKLKVIFVYIFLPFLLIQLIPINRDNPTFEKSVTLEAPPEILSILKNSCYDCHSNETNWPFYSYIAPVSWLVARDVSRGREYLNFSEWNSLSNTKKEIKKEEIIEEISLDLMPMPLYVITHPSASLNKEKKLALKNWLTGR